MLAVVAMLATYLPVRRAARRSARRDPDGVSVSTLALDTVQPVTSTRGSRHMRLSVLLASGVTAASVAPLAGSPVPTIAYTVRVDSAHPETIDVTMRLSGASARLRLAMKVHQEYDAQFWRYLEFGRVSGTANDQVASVTRRDTTLWELSLPGGRGEVHYTLRLPAAPPRRDSWRTTARADGALLNSPDVFLYLPDFTQVPSTVDLVVPASWRVTTSLDADRRPARLHAPDAATLLDAPILLGALRQWSFDDRDTHFTIAYWPLPTSTPFDTVALVQGIRRLSHAALDLFGSMPSRRYAFLIQDGAEDALEHRSSVAIGMPSADLARNPRSHMFELAHEFVHTWNLVAIHPDSYGELANHKAPPTRGLWWGEGVTLHVADVLLRRGGVYDSTNSRAGHIAGLLSRYYGAPWLRRVSPEAASLAFGENMTTNPNATGSYYLQGELIANAIDAAIRDSTHDGRGLDDVLRALYARSRSKHGITDGEWRATADSVCSCHLAQLFVTQVSATGPIDLAPAMARIGYRIIVDTIPSVDDAGNPVPDARLNVVTGDSTVTLIVSYENGSWAKAGLRTGDILTNLSGVRVRGFSDFVGQLRRFRIGDVVPVDVQRARQPLHFDVTIAGFDRPRARIVDASAPTAAQLARRARWLSGW
jgi:predicted metalloprotease with PDZ domain